MMPYDDKKVVERQIHMIPKWHVQIYYKGCNEVGYWKTYDSFNIEGVAVDLANNIKVRVVQDAMVQYGKEEIKGG